MKDLVRSLLSTLIFGIVLSCLYPLFIFTVGHFAFPKQAEGSLVYDRTGRVIGSELIAQSFTDPSYFHPRPSAANYDGTNSQGSNSGPTSTKLKEDATNYRDAYIHENNLPFDAEIPIDAITASGSGLDPHISVKNALIQAKRVAMNRKIPYNQVVLMIKRMTEGRFLGVLGEARVNVLLLNLKLDEMQTPPPK